MNTDLTDLEHSLLMAILRLGSEANGLNVRREVMLRVGKHFARVTIYAALKSLERSGYCVGEDVAGTPARGGFPERYYRLSGAGEQALRAWDQSCFPSGGGLQTAGG